MAEDPSKMCIHIFCGLISSRSGICISEQTMLAFSPNDCIISLLLNCRSSAVERKQQDCIWKTDITFVFIFNSDIEMGELLIYDRGSCYKSNVNCVRSLCSSAQQNDCRCNMQSWPTPTLELTSVNEAPLYCWKLKFFARISVKARNGENQQVNFQAWGEENDTGLLLMPGCEVCAYGNGLGVVMGHWRAVSLSPAWAVGAGCDGHKMPIYFKKQKEILL